MKNKKKQTKEGIISGTQKAAIILFAMTQDNSTKIFSSLKEDEITEVSKAMAALGQVDNKIIDEVITEFKDEISNKLSLVGNLDTTEKLLSSVLGKDKVSAIMDNIKGPMGKSTWDKLSNVSDEMLTSFLKNEHPQTIALIVSKIPTITASKVLTNLPEELSFEVILRLLNMDSVKQEVLDQIEDTIRNDFISSISKVQKRDTHELTAEIFNSFDRTTESKYMELLEKNSPDHAEKVKGLMFTFDDIIKLQKNDVIILLSKIDKNKLAIALKGANDNLKKLFIENMSQRASKIFQEDMAALGPVRIKDVDEAQSTIMIILKELIDKEEIIISTGDNDDEFVE